MTIEPRSATIVAILNIAVGTRLGSYEITTPLGAGGMGEVYRARDARLGRDVAIKVLPASLASAADALARFEREARAVAALSHPNILAIYDIGSDQGHTYAVMELLDGETLRSRLEAASVMNVSSRRSRGSMVRRQRRLNTGSTTVPVEPESGPEIAAGFAGDPPRPRKRARSLSCWGVWPAPATM